VQDVNGKHLLKVEPLNAILDPHYFVRAVHQCTMSVLHGRDADAMQHASENAGYGYASIMPAAVKFRQTGPFSQGNKSPLVKATGQVLT